MLICYLCGWKGYNLKVVELELRDNPIRFVESLCPQCSSPDVDLIRKRTGGTQSIDANLANELRNQGHDATALDLNNTDRDNYCNPM
jgi:hypothetical protein